MSNHELQEQVTQHHTVLFGVEGEGGVVRRVSVVEEKVNSLTAKWIALTTLVGIIGSTFGSILVQLVVHFASK